MACLDMGRIGDIMVEWDDRNVMIVTRQSTGHRIELARTEWNVLIQVAEMHNWPVIAPQYQVVERVPAPDMLGTERIDNRAES